MSSITWSRAAAGRSRRDSSTSGKREGTDSKQFVDIRARYLALITEFFTREIVDRGPGANFGDPPSVDPATKGLDAVPISTHIDINLH